MTHIVTGLIGDHELLRRVVGARWVRCLVDLGQGFALLPLPDGDVETPIPLRHADTGDGFQYLTPHLMQVLSEMSRGGRFAYVETEYFGELGGQGAVVFTDAQLAYGPTWDEQIGPINTALRMLGVGVTPPAIDEFAALGLGRHRMTKDWLASD